MQQVTIIGCETLLAKHLIKLLEEAHPKVSLKLWNNDWSLYEAVRGSDIVFNLHEVQDFSVLPDVDKMQRENVEFVAELLEKCRRTNCPLLVHLSSTYLQCSTKWPNVHGRESESFQIYRQECPFPEYYESKLEAEKIVGYADYIGGRLIARVGPLYGEGDRHSLVCDSMLATKKLRCVPRISTPKNMGVLQFTYAANAAHALLSCAQKMLTMMAAQQQQEQAKNDTSLLFNTNDGGGGGGTTSLKRFCEMVIISDNTPLRDIYSLLLEPIMMDMEGDEDEKEKDKPEEKCKQGGDGTQTQEWKKQTVQNVSYQQQEDGDDGNNNNDDSGVQAEPKEVSPIVSIPQNKLASSSHLGSAIEVVEIKLPKHNHNQLDDGNEGNRNGKKAGKKRSPAGNGVRVGQRPIPYWLFYFPYWLLCVCVWLGNKLFGINTALNKLPSPNYFYLLLRHWTFYSNYKLRIFFDWKPPHDWETSLKRSRAYYRRQLKPERIHGPSWLPVPATPSR